MAPFERKPLLDKFVRLGPGSAAPKRYEKGAGRGPVFAPIGLFVDTPQGNFVISTFVCVDTDPSDAMVSYPLLGWLGPEERRQVYWRLAFASMATSRRVNPHVRHIVFTNDENPLLLDGTDIRFRLKALGVEVSFLPFSTFKLPQGMSLRFANAFYRFQVLEELGNRHLASLVMDADCLWVRMDPELERAITGGLLLVFDVYERSARPFSARPHGISMKDMGETFRVVEPEFPVSFPVWLGTEVIAGTAPIFVEVTRHAHQLVDHYSYLYRRGMPMPVFPNGTGFFNSDEFLFSLIANKWGSVEYLNPFLKRFYALPYLDNTRPGDDQFTLWHLPSEKNTGLMLVYEEVLNPDSMFHSLHREDLPAFLSGLVGVTKRIRKIPTNSHLRDFVRNLKGRVGNLIRNI